MKIKSILLVQALTMFNEALNYCDGHAKYDFSWLPKEVINQNLADRISGICNQANNTHGTGGKALAGAALGLNFGILGAIVGAVGGWQSDKINLTMT